MDDHGEPPLALLPGTVDVWVIDLAATATSDPEDTLSPSERERARLLASPSAAHEFVATRAAVRRTLARYLRREPERVPLEQRCPRCGGPHGKPVLSEDLRGALSLSVSHSHDRVAALAVAAGHTPIGVDVEVLDARPRDVVSTSRRFFTRCEAVAVERAPAAERARLFLTLWTRKEAFLKATGDGLRRPLDSVEVSAFADPRSPEILSVEGGAAGRWAVVDLPNVVGVVGALVCPVGNRIVLHDDYRLG